VELAPSLVLAALLSCLLTGLATRYALRRGILDHPGQRHSHSESTPRGGGIGLVLALLLVGFQLDGSASSPFWMQAVLPGTVIIAAVGWWDDHRTLSARLRFFVQLAVVSYFLYRGLEAGWLPFGGLVLVGGFFTLWMINLYNFMDGSNGMAGLQGIFAGVVLAYLFMDSGDPLASGLSAIVVACCAGFLPWNLGRARVFMGDVGSLSLGFVFASFLLYGAGTGAFSIPVAVMVMSVFLADSTLTLLARVMRRERWYNAHRQHLYQQLIARGWTHGRVAVLYQAINLVVVLPGIVVADNHPALAWPIALALALALGLGWYLSVKRIGVLARAG
jgi:UDP-N-acetylmuramyl pentapeptide phosphotransferase/UDP-N-acetylglucosamine-1-phosphate transferase